MQTLSKGILIMEFSPLASLKHDTNILILKWIQHYSNKIYHDRQPKIDPSFM